MVHHLKNDVILWLLEELDDRRSDHGLVCIMSGTNLLRCSKAVAVCATGIVNILIHRTGLVTHSDHFSATIGAIANPLDRVVAKSGSNRLSDLVKPKYDFCCLILWYAIMRVAAPGEFLEGKWE